MSYIFDALQRAEAERSGTRAVGATELLELAEREITSQGPCDDQEMHPTPDDGASCAPLPASRRLVLEADVEPAVIATRILEAFDTLDVAPPPESRLVYLTDKESAAAEAFRLLGVRLRHFRRARPLQKLLVTSTVPQEGKSMIAANLAGTLAAGTDQPVLLMEGDIRRPTLELFQPRGKPGLCDWLQGRELRECIWRLNGAGFWILPAGGLPENPLGLMQSARLQELMDQLAKWFHWIVIDSPPVLPMADTSVWARMADGILLVTRRGVTRRRHLQRGIEAIDSKKLIGAIVNSATTASEHDYYYYQARRSAEPNGG
jgi:capsular exopolysaccharide synthesis family protein